jgi:hypothetical protein
MLFSFSRLIAYHMIFLSDDSIELLLAHISFWVCAIFFAQLDLVSMLHQVCGGLQKGSREVPLEKKIGGFCIWF